MLMCYNCDKEFGDDMEVCTECGGPLFELIDPEAMEPAEAKLFFGRKDKTTEKWPTLDNGDMDPPAYLCNVGGNESEFEMAANILISNGIPVVRQYPTEGQFVKIVFGYTGAGMDVFVPTSKLEEARKLVEGFPIVTFPKK